MVTAQGENFLPINPNMSLLSLKFPCYLGDMRQGFLDSSHHIPKDGLILDNFPPIVEISTAIKEDSEVSCEQDCVAHQTESKSHITSPCRVRTRGS